MKSNLVITLFSVTERIFHIPSLSYFLCIKMKADVNSPWGFPSIAYCMDHDLAFFSQNVLFLHVFVWKWGHLMLGYVHVLCDYGKKKAPNNQAGGMITFLTLLWHPRYTFNAVSSKRQVIVHFLKWRPMLLLQMWTSGTLHVCSGVCMCVPLDLYDLPTNKVY